jgi:hypothetical protein
LTLLETYLSKLNEDSFTATALNKTLSTLLFTESKRSTTPSLSNEEVFGMLRLAVTGERSPHGGAPRVGEVAEIMGKEEVLRRVKEAREEARKLKDLGVKQSA